jgi:hypothetical protein
MTESAIGKFYLAKGIAIYVTRLVNSSLRALAFVGRVTKERVSISQ